MIPFTETWVGGRPKPRNPNPQSLVAFVRFPRRLDSGHAEHPQSPLPMHRLRALLACPGRENQATRTLLRRPEGPTNRVGVSRLPRRPRCPRQIPQLQQRNGRSRPPQPPQGHPRAPVLSHLRPPPQNPNPEALSPQYVVQIPRRRWSARSCSPWAPGVSTRFHGPADGHGLLEFMDWHFRGKAPDCRFDTSPFGELAPAYGWSAPHPGSA